MFMKLQIKFLHYLMNLMAVFCCCCFFFVFVFIIHLFIYFYFFSLSGCLSSYQIKDNKSLISLRNMSK